MINFIITITLLFPIVAIIIAIGGFQLFGAVSMCVGFAYLLDKGNSHEVEALN